jgi:alcohol dehydrogenase class IV
MSEAITDIGAFEYTALPGRVAFGFGASGRVVEEVKALGCDRAFVLGGPFNAAAAARLAASLGALAVGISTDAQMHTPVAVTDRVLSRVLALRADCLVSLGGGSTIGLGKALAWRTDLPQVVVPTTYAGSEATPILGETHGGHKTTFRSPKVLPEVILYDVELTLSLPPRLSVVSGMNAIAHAVEALYAKDANPMTSRRGEDGIGALGTALPAIVADPGDRAARTRALYGAWLCGHCLGTVGMALHHKICHTLGGRFNLPHAETHTVILPHVVSYNYGAAREAMDRVARALGVADPARGLFDLAATLGVPTSLQEIGMAEADLDEVTAILAAASYWNPRPVDRDSIRVLLEDAYLGRRPSC